jgi:hypothetical protein
MNMERWNHNIRSLDDDCTLRRWSRPDLTSNIMVYSLRSIQTKLLVRTMEYIGWLLTCRLFRLDRLFESLSGSKHVANLVVLTQVLKIISNCRYHLSTPLRRAPRIPEITVGSIKSGMQ